MFYNINNVYLITIILIGIGIIIKSLEFIYISDSFKLNRPNNWDIVGVDNMQTSNLSLIFRNIYSKKGMITLCIISIISLFLLLPFVNNKLVFSLLMGNIFICQFLIHHRQEFGGDGADQMSFLILLTVVLCFIFSDNYEIKKIGIIFISSQLLLSYVISGGAKLISKEWRNGSAVQGILSTYTYGTQLTKFIFNKRPLLAFFVGWLIIVIELLFPFILFFNEPFFLCTIGLGIFLHLSIGIIMGLNDFIWSFTAAYPSLIFLYFSVVLR